MSETILKCEYKECTWKSDKYTVDVCLKLLEIHIAAKHATAPTQPVKTPSSAAKTEKAKRPEIAAEMSDEDWAYFLSRWEEYKKATALEGDEVILQLMECCCEPLRRDHHRTFPKGEGAPATEASRLGQLKQLCVRKKNPAVNRVKLGTLKHDKGEPVRKFAGRVRSLATVSEYSVQCSACKVPVSYTEAVITDQVITGLSDIEIQRDVLSHPESATMDLEKLLQFVEGKESGQASQGLMSGGLVGSVKPMKCRLCGSTHERGKQFCRAAGLKCEKCSKIGHFGKVCRSGNSPGVDSSHVSQGDSKERKADKQAPKVKQQVDAAWGYQDGNWACRVDCEGENMQPDCGNFRSYIPNNEYKNPEFYKEISLYEQAGL
jgi:hypothetical protein